MITLKKRRFINPHMYDGGGFAGLGNIISDTVMPGFISAIQEYNAPVSDNAKKLGDEYVRLRESYNRNPLGIMGFRMANNINSDLNRIEDETANVLKGINTSYSTRSMDDALNNYNNLLSKKNYYDNYDFNMPKNFNRFMKSTLTGTSIGTQIAPGWGTLIGTAAGAAEYLLNSPFNNKILDSADIFGRKAIRNKYNLALASSLNNINNINMWSNMNKSTNYGAYGGPINVGLLPVNSAIDYMQNNDIIDSINNSKQNTKYNFPSFALGGNLMSNGGDWNNGLTYVDNGGTHEENPMGGVMMGVAQDGNPNYVEEGEYVWTNDDGEKYVFSDRLKLPKEFYPLFGIKKSKKEITFADVAQKIDDESSERPNDPIENKGKNDSLYKLMQIQEEERNIEQQQQQLAAQQEQLVQAAYALGGGLNRNRDYKSKKKPYPSVDKKDFAGGGRSYPIPTKADAIDALRLAGLHNRQDVKAKVYKKYPELKHAFGGHIFDDGGYTLIDTTGTIFDKPIIPWHEIWKDSSLFDKYIKMPTSPEISSPFRKKPSFTIDIPGVEYDKNGDIIFSKPSDIGDENTDKNNNTNGGRYDGLPTSGWQTKAMYAPIIGSALGSIYSYFNKPDYEYANDLRDFADKISNTIPNVRPEYLQHNFKYVPFDRLNFANELSSNLAANRRSIINMGNGDYGKTLNALFGAGYNDNVDFGKLYRQGEEYNLDQRLKKAELDKAIDQYNSTADLQAQTTNAEIAKAMAATLLDTKSKELELRRLYDQDYGKNLSSNLDTLFSNLGEFGKYYDRKYLIRQLIKDGVLNVSDTMLALLYDNPEKALKMLEEEAAKEKESKDKNSEGGEKAYGGRINIRRRKRRGLTI